MINLIACVANIENKLCIGKDNDLLFKLKEDMAFFKNLTKNSLDKDSKLKWNVVVMGRRTFYSIPQTNRPLENRFNFVLTNDPVLLKISNHLKNDFENGIWIEGPYFMNIETFKKLYTKFNPNVFVIGGSEIYNYFLSEMNPTKLYITEVKGYKPKSSDKLVFMNNFDSKYRLIGYGEQYKCKGNDGETLTFRTLYYNYNIHKNFISEEYKYLDLAKHILEHGKERVDRTGVGTFSIFGSQMRFDITNGTIPLITTKRVPLKAIIEELLWMMTGNTHNRALQENNVHIWDGNTSRSFLDARNLSHYEEGVLGPGYGFQIRHQGASYSQTFADTRNIDTSKIGGFDQLKYVEDLLKNDPFSRRIMMNYWNPIDFDKTALIPCHYSIQFYVEEIQGERYLTGMVNMRSNDFFLGNPFNLVFYAVLIQILASRSNMKAKELIYVGGDIHIYRNHIIQIKEQLTRIPRPFPKIALNQGIKYKDWSEMKFSDVELIGYFSHPSIKAPMAI
jgi:thymidylate synthase